MPANVIGVACKVACKNNTQVFYMHVRPNVNCVLKDFVEEGDS